MQPLSLKLSKINSISLYNSINPFSHFYPPTLLHTNTAPPTPSTCTFDTSVKDCCSKMQRHCFHITRSTGFHSSPVLNRSLLPSLASKAVPSPLCLWGIVTNWKVLLNVAWFGTRGLEIPPLVNKTAGGWAINSYNSSGWHVSVHMSTCFRYRGSNTSESKSVTKPELQYFWIQTINMFM